jgi:hypothetical protein
MITNMQIDHGLQAKLLSLLPHLDETDKTAIGFPYASCILFGGPKMDASEWGAGWPNARLFRGGGIHPCRQFRARGAGLDPGSVGRLIRADGGQRQRRAARQ